VKLLISWTVLVMIGCAGAPRPAAAPPAAAPRCDDRQAAISHDADARAAPWSVAQSTGPRSSRCRSGDRGRATGQFPVRRVIFA
jgi:hypothetical protein